MALSCFLGYQSRDFYSRITTKNQKYPTTMNDAEEDRAGLPKEDELTPEAIRNTDPSEMTEEWLRKLPRTKRLLRELRVVELRNLVRQVCGSGTWISHARKGELITGIIEERPPRNSDPNQSETQEAVFEQEEIGHEREKVPSVQKQGEAFRQAGRQLGERITGLARKIIRKELRPVENRVKRIEKGIRAEIEKANSKKEQNESPTEEEVTELKTKKETYTEGRYSVKQNRYERNSRARQACIEHYGPQCYVCGFDFEDKYGEIGKGFIHVHHEDPHSEIEDVREVDPIEDMKPLCPNCHGMTHQKTPPYTPKQMRRIIEE